MRILVTGNAGSGKSTLAKILAEKHGLPYLSLDGIVWQEGWKKTPRDIRKRKIKMLTKSKAWVIDGVDQDVMQAADKVIFLDYPRRVCFYRALRRNIPYLFTSRPELPPHCPEILILPRLLTIIWNFPAQIRPKVLAAKEQEPAKYIHIQTNKELETYLSARGITPYIL